MRHSTKKLIDKNCYLKKRSEHSVVLIKASEILMDYLDLASITELMNLTAGKPDIELGLIDGPIFTAHQDLEGANIRKIRGRQNACTKAGSAACIHGTFVAGILSGKRGSKAPSICPGCTLLIYPIFSESSTFEMPGTTPRDLAQAIVSCIDSGVRVLNLSVALTNTSKYQDELVSRQLCSVG
jgi:subtilisin family serine protease